MRVFVAVDIDDKVKTAVAQLQKQLQKNAGLGKGDVKWVRPDDMHLTLKFLGEIDDKSVVEVCSIVKDVCSRHNAFELEIASAGSFGGNSARVLWVGTSAGRDNLIALAADIEEALAVAGWPKEQRDFTAHLTLCRIKNYNAGKILAQDCLQYKDFKAGSVSIDSVQVYQSKLSPAGPEYIVLGRFSLC